MKFRVNDLSNFLEVARDTTMSEAARKLGITQPALSESIKRFESDLEQILFYRSRTGIKLTPSGQFVLDKARVAMSALIELEATPQNKNLFQGRRIRIGCHSTVASYTLPEALRTLDGFAPDYHVEIVHGLSRHIQNEIQQGKVDIGIVINAISTPDLVLKKLGTDAVCVWSAIGAKKNNRIFCNPELIQTQAILRKWKERPTQVVSTESLELIPRLVAQGLGYGIVPEKVVHLIGKPLKRWDSLPIYTDEIFLVHRPEFGKSDFEKIIINSMKSVFT